MKPPNSKVVADLQASAQMLAQICAQYCVDARQLKMMGLKWLSHRIKCGMNCKDKGECKCWCCMIECQLQCVIDRVLYYGADPEYTVGAVAGADTVDSLLQHDQGLVDAALSHSIDARKSSWDASADATPDVHEHVIKCLEMQAMKIARELGLIKQLGEDGYIESRLEDA